MSVDIVVPIYNAYMDVKACVESVLRYTDAEKFRLVLVNDCSTDERISVYLQSLSMSNILVLKNETNQGFVYSVNRGMKASDTADVILLNSDTEVSPNWLERLSVCAQHDPRIATVTPFTNSGAICSLPNFCEDNALPVGFSVERYAELISAVYLRQYPHIPTDVGFCMYIRRTVLSQIGPFDEKTFSKGYGEENDFCYRALQAGYRNVLCDDVFIYHKGSASFGGTQRETLVENHLRLLAKRYPHEKYQTDLFCRQNPLHALQDNIDLFRAFSNGKRSILYILHMPIPYRKGDSQMGGTQKHVMDLCNMLSVHYNVFVLWPEKKEGLCLVGNNGTEWKELFFSLKDVLASSYEDTINQIIEEVLKAFSIDLVHVQHLLGFPTTVVKMIRRLGVPCVLTAHDYYMMCPQINLLKNGHYCYAQDEQCSDCPACSEIDIHSWRKKMGQALENASALIAPDESVARLFHSVYPDYNFQVIEHGTFLPDIGIETSAQEGPFEVAFVGNVAKHKGSARIAEIIEQDHSNIGWHVFGHIEDKRFHPRHPNLHLHGSYQGAEIVSLLRENHVNLVCFFPNWPETYSYVLTECWMAGVPVLGYDLGAVGNRIHKTGYGWLLSPDASTEDILDKIYEIQKDTKAYTDCLKALQSFQPVSLEQMAQKYVELYHTLFSAHRVFEGYDRALILTALESAARGTETMGLVYGEQLESMREKLRKILPNKWADTLLYGQYPFKRQIKRVAVAVGHVFRHHTQ